MAGIFNLVCAMVLFLSLFIVLTNVHGKHLFKFLINLILNISFSFILILLYTCFISQHLVNATLTIFYFFLKENATLTIIVQIICVRVLKLESVFIIFVTALIVKFKNNFVSF